ncbi:MAG: FKBP-type peptidyl-prolyl cis-trans isomerase [Bacteroidales bacterium]|nr:FKBP-type peptidyl-prolyl cis-trans isomerase [Bacteroidales bacterium]
MHIGISLLIGIILIISNCKSNTQLSENTELDTVSYYLGIQAGKHLKEFGIRNLNTAEFERGLNEVLASDSVLSTIEEAIAIKQIDNYLRALHDSLAEKNKKEAVYFLTLNKRKKRVELFKSGLQIKVLRRTKNKKTKSDKVWLRYVIYNISGNILDSSGKKPLLFSRNKLIIAMQEALNYMRKGDKFRLYVPPELAFGKNYPLEHQFEPEMALIIDIELVNK